MVNLTVRAEVPRKTFRSGKISDGRSVGDCDEEVERADDLLRESLRERSFSVLALMKTGITEST